MEGLDWVHIYEDSMNVLMNVELKCFFSNPIKIDIKIVHHGKVKSDLSRYPTHTDTQQY